MQAALDLSKHANKKIAKAAQGALWVIGMEKDKSIPGKRFKLKITCW